MPDYRWITPEQEAFLVSLQPAYVAARAENHLASFYSTAYETFFAHWPQSISPPADGKERALTPSEKLKLQRQIVERERVHTFFSLLAPSSEP